MTEPLQITKIKTEIKNRLTTLDGVSAEMGYFVHFEENKSPLLAVLQADIETPDGEQKINKQVATRHFSLVLGVRITGSDVDADAQRDQFMFDAINVLFNSLSNPLNGLAKEFKHEGDVTFSLTESGAYMVAIIPLQVKFLQTTP
ncbi:hypothetical protein CW745_13890 [Psychromonas sp. psych-6C06]|uniref:hypothetical protein n=1 Tax=Psychromonas sp. psych-6C06 TaxID=2058089 RepID=UPI000C325DC2|nr:hypothetical protein [Psychromonas sp. psych-6C06]PKF60618.1 hypothetical protein CW745_13890 [Psychromonas sp. psych-6C06]